MAKKLVKKGSGGDSTRVGPSIGDQRAKEMAIKMAKQDSLRAAKVKAMIGDTIPVRPAKNVSSSNKAGMNITYKKGGQTKKK